MAIGVAIGANKLWHIKSSSAIDDQNRKRHHGHYSRQYPKVMVEQL